MKRHSVLSMFVALAFALTLLSCRNKNESPQAAKMRLREGFPTRIITQLANRTERTVPRAPGLTLGRLQAVVSRSRLWAPTHIITVAFNGGSPALRQQIVSAVKAWTDVANIALDFGQSSANGTFREWSRNDGVYTADLRISFDQEGYWSAVGRDSIDPSITKPNEASMNFQGFPSDLPDDWQAVVLHEFGHALGFEHEHQSPESPCDQEFRWDDDPGYTRTTDIYGQFVPDRTGKRPGIYTLLEGPPNKWSKDQIDFNLKKLPYSADYITSQFDRLSIMKYFFEDWMFKSGSQSQCYSKENLSLSSGDRIMVSSVYPGNPNGMRSVIVARIKDAQEVIRKPGLPSEVRDSLKKDVAVLTKVQAKLQ